ncbi:MAG TPA: tetratricopeptide repeat protein [Myxococcales bacterium]|nr:tetratricopeptide repeat protein [Myxococcales bacterium]
MIAARLLAAALLALLAGCPASGPTPRERAEGHYIAGMSAYLRGDFKTALAELEEVKKDAPDDPRLPAMLGEIALSQGRLREALEHFDAALARDPKRGTSWSRKGYLLAQLGRRDEAQAALRRALELSDADFNALEQLGELAHQAGRPEEAAAFFERAASRAPQEARRSELYLRAARALQPVSLARAREVLQRGADAGTRTPELLGEQADLEVRLGELRAALSTYQQAAGRASNDPIPWEMAGRVAEKLGDLPGAAQAYQSSLRARPTGAVHAALGRVKLALGDRDGGIAEVDAALASASGEEVREALELADLLEQVGRRADALKLLAQLAAETGAEKDQELQLRTARLAKASGDRAVAAAACARLQRGPDGGTPPRCP